MLGAADGYLVWQIYRGWQREAESRRRATQARAAKNRAQRLLAWAPAWLGCRFSGSGRERAVFAPSTTREAEAGSGSGAGLVL